MTQIKKKLSELELLKKLQPYLLIAPAMLGIGLFVVYPTLTLFYNSFFKVNQLNPDKTKFVGFDNYTKMFANSSFQKSIINTGYYSFFMIVIVLIISLLLAVWISSKTSKINSFVQVSCFLPHIISMVSVGLIFQQMMGPDYGLFNYVLRSLGFDGLQWLQSSQTSLASVIFTSVWKSVGYYTLILVAALKNIPQSIYEAAALDNASKTKVFFKITLPMISPQIFFTVIIMTIGSFKVFDTIKIMTEGGPNDSTISIVYYIYQKVFLDYDIGRASAAGSVLFIIVGVLTVLYFVVLSKKVHYQ